MSANTTENKANSKPVKVYLRVRPLLSSEAETNTNIIDPIDETSIKIQNIRNHAEHFVYNFDKCFNEKADQKDIFNSLWPLMEQVLLGKNTTIFCYGITSSGKTYTMDGTKDSPGLISRAVRKLLEKAEILKKQSSDKFQFLFSHLEVYNEKVFDLSCVENNRRELNLRQNADGTIVVCELKKSVIKSFGDFEFLYKKSRENRSTAATLCNSTSSRSHSVLRIEFVWEEVKGKVLTERSSKLNLIDLAGSEDNRKTGNNKVRMVESGNINKSLLMLSQVVDALNSGQSNIPYRNSKLTRLLQDALGGKAVCAMICNIAPGSQHYLDTLNTLNLARRTKTIEVNEINTVAPITQSHTTSLSLIESRSSDLQNNKRPFDPSLPLLGKAKSLATKKVKQDDCSLITTFADVSLEALMKNATPNTRAGLLKTLEKISLGNDTTDSKAAEDMLSRFKGPVDKKIGDVTSNNNVPVKLKIETMLERNMALKHKNIASSFKEILKPDEKENIENVNENSSFESVSKETKEPEKLKAEDRMNEEDFKRLNSQLIEILNSGNVKKMTQLKGIGLARAQHIVDYQQEHEKFVRIEDLTTKGIVGDKTYKKILSDFYNKHF